MQEEEYIHLPVFLNKDTQPAPRQQGRKRTSPHQQDLCSTGGDDKEMWAAEEEMVRQLFSKKAPAFVLEEHLLWERDFN